MLCQKLIWLPDEEMKVQNKQSRVSTYCMRQAGHEGKCSETSDVKEAPVDGQSNK